MTTMTYGTMPTWEEFEAAFERELPDGSFFEIHLSSSDSRSVDDFVLGDGFWTAEQLYGACNDISEAYKGGSQVESEKLEQAMDLVSSIMYTLGFEWV